VLNCVKSFVIGTTGHSKELTELIEQVSKHVPVIIASNFSKGVFLFEEILRAKTTSGLCVSDLARELGFDLGLFETHHSKKKDAPSGTAVTLAKAAAIPASAVASLRVGSVIGEHTLLASAESEEIRITHTAQNRKLFALGAVSLLERMESLKVEPSLHTFRDIFSKS
jgi:4-hydroxy-tetrahydrodipicolinate reductase